MKDSLNTVANNIVGGTGMRTFLMLHRVEMGILILISAVVLNLLLKFKWTKHTILTIIDDTLKVNDGVVRRYSGTKMTMLVAFVSVLWAFHYTTIKDGYVESAFLIMACISTGVSIAGAYSKKINPPTETKAPEEIKPPGE